MRPCLSSRIVNRDYTSGKFIAMLNGGNDITYTLDVATDGKTAKIAITMKNGMTQGCGPQDRSMSTFGKYSITQHITIDLAADTPTVTDVKLSQSFSENLI